MNDTGAVATIYTGRLAKHARQPDFFREWMAIGGMVLTVVALNVLGWGLLSAAAHPPLPHISKTGLLGLGTGVLAYTLGMRHAFDADHIAAIDNTTRKLVNDGKRPPERGGSTSPLGHSSVVFLLAVFLNFGIRALDSQVSNSSSGLHESHRGHRHRGVQGSLPLPDPPSSISSC